MEQYTGQWERRMFKRIGNFLMQHNKSIAECFDLIDTNQSETIAIEDLQRALIRFQLGLSDKHLKMFMGRLQTAGKPYITKREFLHRFWAAYTYEEDHAAEGETLAQEGTPSEEQVGVPSILESASHNIKEARKKIRSELETKAKAISMFRAIQKQIAKKMPCHLAF